MEAVSRRKHQPRGVGELRYDPKNLIKKLNSFDKERLDQNFPESRCSNIERHRAIVTGCLGLRDNEWYERTDTRKLGIFFLAENGERQIFAGDIYTYCKNNWPFTDLIDNRGRHHNVVHYRGRKVADKMSYGFGAPHQSESQWNLPSDHPRHFSKFPAEIRLQILAHILTVPGLLSPEVITCTWKRELQKIGYRFYPTFSKRHCHPQLNKRTTRIPLEDKHGPYIQLRDVYTKPIDATCLRVSKQFRREGASVLYGWNNFDVSNIPDFILSHGAVYTIDNLQEGPRSHRAQMPRQLGDHEKGVMAVVSTLMGGYFPNWAYCDPFLRFLRFIGPLNASLLKSISLYQSVNKHNSGDPLRCDSNCVNLRCLCYVLRLYAPFVEKYCPGIRKLCLKVSTLRREPEHQFEDFNRELLAILRAEIPKFRNLRSIILEADSVDLSEDVKEFPRNPRSR